MNERADVCRGMRAFRPINAKKNRTVGLCIEYNELKGLILRFPLRAEIRNFGNGVCVSSCVHTFTIFHFPFRKIIIETTAMADSEIAIAM